MKGPSIRSSDFTERIIPALSGAEGTEALEKAFRNVGSLKASDPAFKKLKTALDTRFGDSFAKTVKTPKDLVAFLRQAHDAKPAGTSTLLELRAQNSTTSKADKPTTIEDGIDKLMDVNSALADANKGKRPAGEQEVVSKLLDLQDGLKTATPETKKILRDHLAQQMQPGMPLGDELLRITGMSEIQRLLVSNLPIEALISRILILLADESSKELKEKLKELQESDEANAAELNQDGLQQELDKAVDAAEQTDAENRAQAEKAAIEQAAQANKSLQTESPGNTKEEKDDEAKVEGTKKDDQRQATVANATDVDNQGDPTPTVAGDPPAEPTKPAEPAKPTEPAKPAEPAKPIVPAKKPRKSQQTVLQELQMLQQRHQERMSMLNGISSQLHQMLMELISKLGR